MPAPAASSPTEFPVAAHVVLVPEGISSMRDIPGLSRATQGERNILTIIQRAIDTYAGRPVDQFWTGVWTALAKALRMDTVYLAEALLDLSSTDFLFTRVLHAVEVAPDDGSLAATAADSSVYAVAQRSSGSMEPSARRPQRLDLRPGAIARIPRSIDAQVHNEGLTCFHINEVFALTDQRSTITSTSGDGTNHYQILPVSVDVSPLRRFFLGLDHLGVSESIASFDELVTFVHWRLNEALDDFVRTLLARQANDLLAAAPTAGRIAPSSGRYTIQHRTATGAQALVLARDFVLGASPTWPWQRRVLGLFTVEGLAGQALTRATADVQAIIEPTFKNLCSMESEQAAEQFWEWHQKVYALGKRLKMPVRVSATILATRMGLCELHSLGTVLPVIQIPAKGDLAFHMPQSNFIFLGYNPMSTSGVGELAHEHPVPTDRMHDRSFIGASRLFPVQKSDVLLIFNHGWLEQFDRVNPAYDLACRYGIAGLMNAIGAARQDGQGKTPDGLAARLGEDVSALSAVIEDATLVALTP